MPGNHIALGVGKDMSEKPELADGCGDLRDLLCTVGAGIPRIECEVINWNACTISNGIDRNSAVIVIPSAPSLKQAIRRWSLLSGTARERSCVNLTNQTTVLLWR